ncbi:hypothetical protein V6N11_038213 [Hibiscus sabdariffa]|uniref:DUF4283 domain-containing protein n=1 Tax=Hibiscus sabdariffa TaxID=183260 RepID=A0ABR2SJZ1_9ROSI
MSYKDSLMNESNEKPYHSDCFVVDDDIEILDGEVTRSVIDGLISIQFSDRIQTLAAKSMDHTIVLKLLDIENGYFLATFRSHEDFLTVLADSPWTIFGHYLTVEPWSSDFSPSQSSIRLYYDIWVPSLGPLCLHTLVPQNALGAQSITDLVSSDGTWYMPALQHLFTDAGITHIIAYLRLADPHWPPNQSVWKLIWRLTVSQRVRLFLWLPYKQRLMTNATRHRRNLTASPTCPLCSNQSETILHSLRDCVEVRQLWLQILHEAIKHSFFAVNLHHWLSCNISAGFFHPSLGLPWVLVFAAFA